jgi:TolB protein
MQSLLRLSPCLWSFLSVRRRLRNHLCFLLVITFLLLFVLGGCIQPSLPQGTIPPQASITLAEASQNRLLVLSEEGNIFTLKPDGGGRYDLTTDATPNHFYTQPTWSPTGERIAWAEVNRSSEEFSGALLASTADGGDRTRVEALFPPFYLNWSPDGNQLAFLSNWMGHSSTTIALRLVDVARGEVEARTLGVGAPFYFSWAPDSQQMLTHVGSERVGLLALDGTETLLADDSARFATPQWNGERLLYGVHVENRPQLVIADSAGMIQQLVTFFQGETATAFSLSPDGQRVAYTETDAPASANSFGPLFIFDRATEEYEQLTAEPVMAFFWSPDGSSLLFMNVEFEGERPWLRVQIWDGEETRKYSRFIPSNVFFNQYLPFADQYAQSIRVWAPDGSAFVYTGRGENGDFGVWVHALDAEAPELVAEGVFATWSPR